MKKFGLFFLMAFAISIASAQGVVARDSLLDVYITGAKPTQQHFHSWINSYYHLNEDIPVKYNNKIYIYKPGATTGETDGNVKLSYPEANRFAISTRESGVWSDMFKVPSFPGINGRFASINTNTSFLGGLVLNNIDTNGFNALLMVMPTSSADTFSISQNFNGVSIKTPLNHIGKHKALLLNQFRLPLDDGTPGQVLATNGSGVLGFVTASGSGLWSSAAGGKIYYSTGFVGIGTNNPPYPLSMKHNTDLSSDRVLHVENFSGTAQFDVWANNKISYEAQQPSLWLNATTPTDSVRGSFMFKYNGVIDIAAITVYNTDMVLSSAFGDVVVGTRKLLLDNGAFEIKATDAKDTWLQANDFYGVLKVGNVPLGSNSATFNVVPTIGEGHAVAGNFIMNNEGIGASSYAGSFTNNATDAANRSYGVRIDARNSAGLEYPLVAVDENIVSNPTHYTGAQLFVDNVTSDGAAFSIHPRGLAQIQTTYADGGNYAIGLPTPNVFSNLHDSVVANSGTWYTAASSEILRLWTRDPNTGALEYTGWNTATIVVECSASISTTIAVGDANPRIAVGIAKNGATSPASTRDYTLPSTVGRTQVFAKFVTTVTSTDEITFTIATRATTATGTTKPQVTIYGSRCEITSDL